MTPPYRPTRVEVDLGAIRDNVRSLRETVALAELMAVVKANAYGHGDVPVAHAVLEAGATWLGVALVEEGLTLREAGIDAPILVLSEPPPGSERALLAANLTPVLCTRPALERLRAAAPADVRPEVHVKVDTGMHRIGVWPSEEAAAFLTETTEAGFAVTGLLTHFARADEDVPTTTEQLERFSTAAEAVRAAGHDPGILHAANTAGSLAYPEARFDLVRTGLGVYGVNPAPGFLPEPSAGLRPALTWRSAVALARRLPAGEGLSYGHRYRLDKDSMVATVPVGYADGYPRSLSSEADVLIRGRRCRVAGSVTMDQLVIDCGDVDDVSEGDEVVLLGRQGSEEVTAMELAERAGTIPYEILAGIGPRIPREHIG